LSVRGEPALVSTGREPLGALVLHAILILLDDGVAAAESPLALDLVVALEKGPPARAALQLRRQCGSELTEDLALLESLAQRCGAQLEIGRVPGAAALTLRLPALA
jgi:hypothetical protein